MQVRGGFFVDLGITSGLTSGNDWKSWLWARITFFYRRVSDGRTHENCDESVRSAPPIQPIWDEHRLWLAKKQKNKKTIW